MPHADPKVAKLYRSGRWQKRAARQKRDEPLCRRCRAKGILNDGSLRMDGTPQPNPKRRFLVANHNPPHKGDLELFWHGPLETLCPDHHDLEATPEDRADGGIDPLTGWPRDPAHPAAGG